MRRRVFHPDQKLYAAKPLKSLGQEFEKGQEIPWKTLGWRQQTMQEWFNARIASHFPGGDMSPEAVNFYKGFDAPGIISMPQQPPPQSRKGQRATR